MAALAGRRLYLTIDVDPAIQPNLPLSLTLSTFSATWQVRTHHGVPTRVGRGRIELSLYVPDDAAHFYWTLAVSRANSGPEQEQPKLIIRNAQTHVSATKFRPEQLCLPCREYLDNTLQRVRRESLVADRLQLDELEASLRLAATGAQDIREMDSTLKELARKLQEAELSAGLMPHGSYQTKAELALSVTPVQATPTQKQKQHANATLFETKLLGQRVGYIRLSGFLQSDHEAGRTYARALRDAIDSLHRRGADHWVLDLRGHSGGTLFPAIAALRPLLGKGAVGYFVDRNGKRHGDWVWGDPSFPIEIAGNYFSKKDSAFNGEKAPTAILLGAATSSSGEMVAIAFHGRANTRSFGTPTSGYTTANHGAPDQYGNFFGIASQYSADRNGKPIFPKVVPDVVIEAKRPGADQPDPILNGATAWLEAQQ